jgi:hypothetical protein
MSEAKRFHLLDLLKICCLLAIQTLHVWEFVFFLDPYTLSETSVVYTLMTNFARVFSLGGQVLVAIIFFLFGYTSKSRSELLRISLFALVGQSALSLAFMEDSFLQALEWDIYGFLFVSCILLALIPLSRRSSLFWPLLYVPVLLTPPAMLADLFPPGLFFDIISGRRSAGHSGAWALLPWFFHALMFLNLGSILREKERTFSSLGTKEGFVWGALLLSSLPFLGFYFHTPIGPSYYDFNFNQPPWIFWPNFIPFFFWMRVSLVESIEKRAGSWRVLQWVSGLMWCRRLGLTYLVAVVYVGIGADHRETFQTVPYAFDLFYIGVMPVSEVVVRMIVRLTPVGKRAQIPGGPSSR